jgi:hypothetical protein
MEAVALMQINDDAACVVLDHRGGRDSRAAADEILVVAGGIASQTRHCKDRQSHVDWNG